LARSCSSWAANWALFYEKPDVARYTVVSGENFSEYAVDLPFYPHLQ